MSYRLRHIEAESKFSQALTLDVFSRVVPMETMTSVLHASVGPTPRERKLNLRVMMLMVIVMNLYTHLALGAVLRQLAQGLRYIWPDPDIDLPTASAIAYRRRQLGARPMVALFHRVCRPLATAQTPGAFLFGLRLMALDGTVEAVADTPANAAAFGRQTGSRGDSAFPQIRCVYLAECGTHGIIDAGVWPYGVDESVGAFRLLRSVSAAMLLLWDRGLHDFDLLEAVRQRDAHVLSRLPAYVKPDPQQRLSDGTLLAYLRPSDPKRRRRGDRLAVRVIEYTLTDPTRPGHGESHRLVTTLLEPEVYPALDLVCAYHERWELEVTIDEIDTHQRLAETTLRSLTPVGVIQEVYGLLIAHYAVRSLMHAAAEQAQVDPDRLSFVHAIEVIRQAIPEFQMTIPTQLPALYTRLLRDIAAGRLPPRRLRSNPRVVKRKMSKFHLKRPEHYHTSHPTQPFRQTVTLI